MTEKQVEQEVEETEVAEMHHEEEVVNEEVDSNDEALASLEEREKALFQRGVFLTLKESDLEQFSDVIAVTDDKHLETVVKQLKQIVNDLKISLSYQPENNQKQDAISIAEQNKDVKGMLGAKFSKIFK